MTDSRSSSIRLFSARRRLSGASASSSAVRYRCISCCTRSSKARSRVGNRPLAWVGVTRFEPAAASSRTTGSADRLSNVPAKSACRASHVPVAVRGRCCTSVLYEEQPRIARSRPGLLPAAVNGASCCVAERDITRYGDASPLAPRKWCRAVTPPAEAVGHA